MDYIFTLNNNCDRQDIDSCHEHFRYYQFIHYIQLFDTISF